MDHPQKKGIAVTARLAPFSLFLGSLAVYLRCAAPSVTAGDAGEFMTVAATLSLAHPPSYPLYALLGRGFIELIPFASIPFRLNVFSAFTSSLSLVFLFLIARQLGASTFLSLLISAVAGFSVSFWLNSLITEVFSLNTLFATGLLWLLLKTTRSSFRLFFLFAFLWGVGLSNHHVLVFMGAPFLVFWISRFGFRAPLQPVLCTAFFFFIGFSVYLFLPVRSQKEPPLNWGSPTTASKLARTITRKDYGSFSLALGETPPRTIKNAAIQIKRFGWQLMREAPWPLFAIGLGGLLLGLRAKEPFYIALFFLFLLSGPGFFLLANLPFTAQSEGIMGRFFILPVVTLVLGILKFAQRFSRWAITLLAPFIIFMIHGGWAEAKAHREANLVLDYGRAMLRTMPPGTIFFMDGGDDAFYSLAMLRYVSQERPDVELHDRGGLVFRNIYGEDFRRLTKEEKARRRQAIEREMLGKRPLLYSTMDWNVLPGVPLRQSGFLLEAGEIERPAVAWPLICLRSLHPLRPSDYRTRALAAFFPYMRGRSLIKTDIEKGLRCFRKSFSMGAGVDWVQTNLSTELLYEAFERLKANRFHDAERIYTAVVRMFPQNEQAHSNLGVVYERLGRWDQAKAQYQKAAGLFPHAADPVFNLAVMAWHKKEWPSVVHYLEEVLKRNPNHPSAMHFLRQARQKI